MRELIGVAFGSIRAGGLRSFLSVLGIVIGVAAVIALVSVGQGATAQIQSQLTSLGSNLLTIMPSARTASGGRVSQEQLSGLTMELADELPLAAPAVSAATGLVQSRATLVVGASNLSVSVMGVGEAYASLLNYRPVAGRFVQPRDGRERRMAVVLGFGVAQDLFGGEVPVGRDITLVFGGRPVAGVVVGVMEPKGALFFSNFDRQIYVPAQTLVARGLVPNRMGSYLAQTKPGVDVDDAVAQVTFFFDRRLGEAGIVQVASQQALLDAVSQATGTMTLLLGAIAGIALLVGGIGIMNVMLVAVAERTHEIGVRMAIGARRADILRQFLAESTALSVVGGVVGLLAGWAGGWALSRALGFPFVVSSQSIVLAIGFSMAVGIFFGIYPARRASRLDPVEALRYE
ncbi:ABC transporter permease [Geochorda subterranea]|uniref:ABC transporter permease n=1 Tax=Geochorda subterranea TaxID=3109564 RepID=A0ABZ1BT25_9FIRM|nr:ABC transporter permease [Limnochorda sp. LNt]WRP15919.1 ABC transporter permease [Limnochorda sp. LNt]